MAARVAEWVPASQLRRLDWVIEPSCGQHGRIELIETTDELVTIQFAEGHSPPGITGFAISPERDICRMRKIGKRK